MKIYKTKVFGVDMEIIQKDNGKFVIPIKNIQKYGTALKPAWEPIIVARKPLSEKSVAENVLKYGTGGINIEGCRIDLKGDYKCKANGRPSQTGLNDNYNPSKANISDNKGRFPANFIHDGSDDVLELFPNTKSGKPGIMHKGKHNVYKASKYIDSRVDKMMGGFGDEGSAARFFYCAKASKSERNLGLENFKSKKASGLPMRKKGGKRKGVGIDGTTTDRLTTSANNHPTVKPLALMQYLVRLTKTPYGGIVLDPFAGSGTTGIACIKERRHFILIEKEKEYVKIAVARCKHFIKRKK